MSSVKYYFVLGSQNFLYKEEPIEEILRERVRNYNASKKPLNFWLVPNPNFLNSEEFLAIKNKTPNNSVAIVSTDKTFITWLKLRLNNVLVGNFEMKLGKNISPLKF
jgi:hypothetical protein